MKLLEQLKKDEGFSERVYFCTEKFPTIGYGYNLSANTLKLSELELQEARHNGVSERKAFLWLNRVVEGIEQQLDSKIGFFKQLDEARQDVLINMAYQQGVDGVMKYKDTLLAMRHGDFELAAVAMLDSKWARQTPKRAKRLAEQMKNGY